MKILYMGILRNETKDIVQLAHETRLQSYSIFTRKSVAEIMQVVIDKVAEKTAPEQKMEVQEEGYTLHARGRVEGICGVIVADEEYPGRVAQQLLGKVLDEFTSKYPRTKYTELVKPPNTNSANVPDPLPFPELKDYIEKYQDPGQADSIMKIQNELAETKVVLHKTIESVLDRGEKIDSLVAKSDGLSAQSKMFYTQAKKQNSCCVVM